MAYADITYNDKNYFKRSFQRKRLVIVCDNILRDLKSQNKEFKILDYGCGNAELLKYLHPRLKHFFYTGYDPMEEMIEEAKSNIKNSNGITLTKHKSDLQGKKYDIIFCLEVFEHFPEAVLIEELNTLRGLLAHDGLLVFGVPNEVYLPALVRGAFRMTRRYGEFDATFKNVLSSAIGKPPKDRNVNFNESGTYLFYHMGFDHRKFIKTVKEYFTVEKVFGSPFSFLPVSLNTEVYIRCRK